MFHPRNILPLAVAVLLLPAAPLQARLAVVDDAPPNGVLNAAYSYSLVVKGGTSPYTWTITAGALPAGVTLSTAGVLSGTPTASGVFQFTAHVVDSSAAGAQIVNKQLTLTIVEAAGQARWCARGGFDSEISSVETSSTFASDRFAYAGTAAGGVLATTDGGQVWGAVPGMGNLRVGDLAISPCAGATTVWAITTPRAGATAAFLVPDPAASIYRYNGATLVKETGLPTFTGDRRRIRTATCNGGVLASDTDGGIAYRDPSTGTWSLVNQGLSTFGGSYAIYDIALYQNGATLTGFALDAVNQNIWVRTDFTSNGRWTACHFLPNGPTRYTLGVTPDGRVLVGDLLGKVVAYNGLSCNTAPFATLTGGGIVERIVPSPCYGSAAGVNPVYVATQYGLYYKADAKTTGALTKVAPGLQSEWLRDVAVSNLCSDPSIIVATRGRGPAYGDTGFVCHGTQKDGAGADLAAIAGDSRFSSPGAAACQGGAGPVGLHAATVAGGMLRSSRDGRELFSAGDSREQRVTDVTATVSAGADWLYAAAESGVYRSTTQGRAYSTHYLTDEPILKLAGLPESGNGAAYGVGLSGVYYSLASPAWSKVADFAANNFTQPPEDLAAGGSLSSTLTDHELWIAMGTDGVAEYQRIGAGAPVLITHRGGLTGVNVRRITAQRRPGLTNLVYVQVLTGGASPAYRMYRGTKGTTPNSSVSFVAQSATGLPTTDEAAQIVAEPSGNVVWVLLPKLGLYLSTNAGGSYTLVAGTGLPANYDPVQLLPAVNFNYASGQRDVALLLAGEGVYYSRDAGNTFCYGPTPVGQFSRDLRALAVSTANDYTLAAGTGEGVFASSDRGVSWSSRTSTATEGLSFNALVYHPGVDRLIAGTSSGIYSSDNNGVSWTLRRSGVAVTGLLLDGANNLFATLAGAPGLRSTDAGVSWTTTASAGDGLAAAYNASTALSGRAPAGATAPYWMAGSASGASWSADGVTWTAAPGGNDYVLPASGSYQSIASLGGTPSKVLIGNSTQGLWRSLDGGDTWRLASGTGSGLELTSQNAATLLTAQTAFSTTDSLVGMVGGANGGVYLSGDNGAHWTQVNQGYDPNNLSIGSLVKTSCAGCPVQYYSGTYGSGVYTRTITVNPPPAFPVANYACFGSTVCACATTGGSGPEQGGQAFKLCGTGFANGIVVEFDGVPATGCTQSGGTVITCTGTPPHAPGSATLRVRNPDTRAGTLPASYTYLAGAPRTGNTLRAAKSTADAWISWSCASCTAGSPARLYRGQDALLSLYPENYNGGASGAQTGGCTPAAGTTSCHNQTGATGSAQNYFWSVE